MRHWFHWFTLSAFAAILAVSPALAANAPASSARDHAVTLTAPASAQLPAATTVANKPILTARAPFETTWNSTVLAMNSQAMGLQATGASNNHVRWTIAGAAIGAIVGAVADDPLRDALIGGAVGFAGSYVMKR
jgi:Glycine zipper